MQGIGGACLLANAAAIITDAFPANQRGMALGINNIVGVSGLFIGLVLGGILAPIDWRLVFLISVPVGLFGTVWAYLQAARAAARRAARRSTGRATSRSRVGLVLIMIAVTYGIRPVRAATRSGWSEPARARPARRRRSSASSRSCSSSAASHDPMFRLPLFRIRAFTFGTLSTFLSAVARGGLMFMLIIWLQGIWLPQHGYDFTETPLWAGIYMLPLTIGMLSRARPRATCPTASARARSRPAGCSLTAVGFGLLLLLPTDFSYPVVRRDPAADRGRRWACSPRPTAPR